jgi:hypothetical protein
MAIYIEERNEKRGVDVATILCLYLLDLLVLIS